MQKALIVNDNDSGGSLANLNYYLSRGWKIIQSCPMPSSLSSTMTGSIYNYNKDSILPTCLVIIEEIKA